MTLKELKRKLKHCHTDRDVVRCLGGKYIGEGLFRQAFKVDRWVVKKYIPSSFPGTETVIKRYKIRLLKGHRVGKWVIQPYCRKPKTNAERRRVYRIDEALLWESCDIHDENLGFYRNQLVAFDW